MHRVFKVLNLNCYANLRSLAVRTGFTPLMHNKDIYTVEPKYYDHLSNMVLVHGSVLPGTLKAFRLFTIHLDMNTEPAICKTTG